MQTLELNKSYGLSMITGPTFVIIMEVVVLKLFKFSKFEKISKVGSTKFVGTK